MAGTGSRSASSGSQMRAARRVPSANGIHVWSMRRTARGSRCGRPRVARVYGRRIASRDEHAPDLYQRRTRRRDRRGVRGAARDGACRRRRRAAGPPASGRSSSRAASASSASTRAPTRRWPAARSRRRPRSSPAPSTPRAGPPGRGAGRRGPQRCALLRAVAGGIGERHLELAAVVSLETGKSRTESILEVQEAIDLITTYADHMEGNDGYVVPLASFVADERNTDVLRPYGVFAVIAPFNFPAALSIGMAASALIAGNTVVFKPSEETPWTGAILGEIARAAELPPGRLQPRPRRRGDRPRPRRRARRRRRLHRLGRGRARDRAQAAGGPLRAAGPHRDGRQEPRDRHRHADLDQAAEGVGPRRLRPRRAEVQRVLARDRDGATSTTRSSSASPRGPRACRSATPPIARASWGRSSTRRASRASRTPSPPRAATASWPPAADDPIGPGTSSSPPSSATSRSAIRWSATSCSCRSSRSPGSASLDEALAEANAPAYGLTAGVFSADHAELDRFLDEIQAGVVYVNRRAGATTGAWPGTQSFCGWKSSGSTGKGGLGPYYLRAVHARAEPDRGRIEP